MAVILLHPHSSFSPCSLPDLETDYINPYELATKINSITLPEFITQGVLCFLHLVTGHWIMYIHKRHLVYATEVFGELSREKKQRIFKLDDLEYRGFGLRRWHSQLSTQLSSPL
ncbi:hypothetical protein M8C21_027380 [Ambrosia artemisiifolia]|uniref:Uncharacterized protein n=1 Tax=Ambrosia artemisiifolia TaxID=4212 RepID=A0AAD5CC63_AMBAR|nr:hypothetical protein M8C21_027380 [Ambrosia artemisiifolia]